MAKNKYTDLICILIIVLMIALTVLFINGEALGLRAAENTPVNASASAVIQLLGDSAKVRGSGAVAEGDTVLILYGGEYTLTGTLSGQIQVETGSGEKVTLILSGAEIACEDGPALWVKNAGEVTVKTVAGTENRLDAGASFSDETVALEVDAALYSEDDLVLDGAGTLHVTCLYRHGIVSKDQLRCEDGDYAVEAAGDGIRGRDSLTIRGGSYTVAAGGDALKSNNDQGEGLGVVTILGGSFDLTAERDGIQAETALEIAGGDFVITTGGGAGDPPAASDDFPPSGPMEWQGVQADNSESAKGLKAGVSLTVSGGSFVMDCVDDCLHCDGDVSIRDGSLTLRSGEDAVRAEETLSVEGGRILISQCAEGLEAHIITLDAAEIDITASDDGINVITGGAGSGDMPVLTVNGGTLRIYSNGDGLDSNGDIRIHGGLILISAQASHSNAAMDCGSERGGTCLITGGTVVACGFSGMAENFESASAQCSLLYNLEQTAAGGTYVALLDGQGRELASHTPENDFNSVLFSAAELEVGETYTVQVGSDGYEVTLTGVCGSYGAASGGFGFGGERPSGGMQQGQPFQGQPPRGDALDGERG